MIGFFCLVWLGVMARFFYLQVWQYKAYKLLASDQHEIERSLTPERGGIYVKDKKGDLHPIAKDRPAWNVYGVPREMKDASSTISLKIA